jgi:hypothetical protein
VESFDRLSRQEVRHAMRLFNDLVDAGLIIHTLGDEQVYWAEQLDGDPTRIIYSIIIMMRGNNESKEKQRRSLDNVRRARELARTEKIPLNRAPAWIDIVSEKGNKKFQLNRHAATVGRIFEEAAQGLTIHEICRRLNTDHLETLGGSTHWQKGTVSRILMRTDAAIGTCQPHTYVKEKGKKKRRIPLDVPLITDYYPAVVSYAVFQRARENIRNRLNPRARGYTGPIYQNLLKGLCVCGRCGGQVHYQSHGGGKRTDTRGGPRIETYLNCYNTIVGTPDGTKCEPRVSFPYYKLEPLLFKIYELYEVATALFKQDTSDTAERIAELELRVEQLTTARNRLYDMVEKGDDVGEARLRKNLAELNAAKRELEELRIDHARTTEEVEQAYHDQFHENMKRIEAEDQEVRRAARMALATEFRRIVDTVILNSDCTLTMKLKPQDGRAFVYEIAPDGIKGFYLANIEGKPMSLSDMSAAGLNGLFWEEWPKRLNAIASVTDYSIWARMLTGQRPTLPGV